MRPLAHRTKDAREKNQREQPLRRAKRKSERNDGHNRRDQK